MVDKSIFTGELFKLCDQTGSNSENRITTKYLILVLLCEFAKLERALQRLRKRLTFG